MALRFGFVLLILWEPTLALPPGNKESDPPWLGSSSHSLYYFYTGVSETAQMLPQFIVVGYVDGQPFVQYDSNTRRAQPRAPWIEKVEVDDPHYWEWSTQRLRNSEQLFRENLAILSYRYNQSGGFHSLQEMHGCELRKDGSKGGFEQFAYDGKDYISFDKETLTWTAVDPIAQVTQMKWDRNEEIKMYLEKYFEEVCIEWLNRYLRYGKGRILRTVPPVGKVTRTYLPGGRERLVCQAHGFYPKEIETNWKKGEDIKEEDTGRRTIAPNSDGTFHDWISIEIDSEDRDLYRCHIDHDGMKAPLVLAWEAPGDDVGSIVGIMVGVVAALVLVAFGIVFFLWQQQMKSAYNTAPTSETSSDRSVSASDKSSDSSVRGDPLT